MVLNYSILFHSIEENIDRLTGAGAIKSLSNLIQSTHDVYIRGYAIKTVQLLNDGIYIFFSPYFYRSTN